MYWQSQPDINNSATEGVSLQIMATSTICSIKCVTSSNIFRTVCTELYWTIFIVHTMKNFIYFHRVTSKMLEFQSWLFKFNRQLK